MYFDIIGKVYKIGIILSFITVDFRLVTFEMYIKFCSRIL